MVSKNQVPKVLLFGNGALQCFGGESWNKFLASIATKEEYRSEEKIQSLDCPAPLKAILVTNDHVDNQVRNKFEGISSALKNECEFEFLREFLLMNFDHILTTNYTYELENVAQFPDEYTFANIKRLSRHTQEKQRAESKYMIHSYNEIILDSTPKKIWHIHGEIRKPNSVIIGHYYYGNLLSEIKKISDGRRDAYRREQDLGDQYPVNSWVDAFILGEIYCVGFGFDFSEFDLWWLLNRKAREKAQVGDVYFYNPASSGFDEKRELLASMRKSCNGEQLVKMIDCGYSVNKDNPRVLNEGKYIDFYKSVIKDIQSKMDN